MSDEIFAKRNRGQGILMVAAGVLGFLCTVALIFFGTRNKTYSMPSGSMLPSIVMGDKLFADQTAYNSEKPKRGDIIVFRFPKDETISYIKRVVGLPGEEITVKDKVLYINGQEIKVRPLNDAKVMGYLENDDDRKMLTLFEEDLFGHRHAVLYNMSTLMNSDYGPVRIPEGRYFTLGDNRDKSSDSRFWGFVPEENITGKAETVYFSWHTERIGMSLH